MDPAARLRSATAVRVADTPLDALSYTVLDLETTGGAPPEHRITEIAAWRVEGLEVTQHSYHTLVNPQRKVPVFVSSLTGITDEMLAQARPSSAVLGELVEFIGDSVVVAHHTEFDVRFINHELRLSGAPPLANAELCTCLLARRLLPWLPSKSLGNLAGFFGIAVPKRHRADSDAFAAAQLLTIMLRYLLHRGITTYRDALRYQEARCELPAPAAVR